MCRAILLILNEIEDLGRFYDEASSVVKAQSATPVSNPRETTATKPPIKLEVYERYLRIPHYLVYSRHTQRLRYFNPHSALKLSQGVTREATELAVKAGKSHNREENLGV